MLSTSKSPMQQPAGSSPIHARIVLVHDNMEQGEAIIQRVRDGGIDCEVQTVGVADELEKALNLFDPHLVLSWSDLEGLDGSAVIRISRRIRQNVPVIVLIDRLDEERANDFIRRGAYDYVQKQPPGRLPLVVRHALEWYQLTEQNKRLQDTISTASKELDDRVKDKTTDLSRQLNQLQADYAQRSQLHQQIRDRERKYRLLLEEIGSIVIRWSTDGRISFINTHGLEYFGYTEQDVIGYHMKMLLPAEGPGREQYRLVDRILRSPEEHQNIELQNVRADGTRVWIAWSNKAIRSSDGKLEGVLSVGNDITRLKKTERSLEQKQALLDAFFGRAPVGMTVVDSEKRILRVNPIAARYLGKETSDIEGKKVSQLIHADIPEIYAAVDKVLADGKPVYRVESEGELEGRKGQHLHVISSLFPMSFPDGREAVGVVSLNMTQKRDAEEALQQSQARYRELVQSSNSAIIRWSPDGTILFANSFCARQFGYPPSEMVGMPLTSLFPKEDVVPHDIESMTRDMLANPLNYINMIHKNLRVDGSFVWVAWTNRPVKDENGKIVEFLSVGNDITELVQAETALKKSEALFRNFVNNVDAVIVRLSMEGMVTFINHYGEIATGKPFKAISAKPYVGTIVPGEECDVRGQLATLKNGRGGSVRFECPSLNGKGETRWMHWTAKVIYFGNDSPSEILCTGVDITERRQIEQALAQAREEAESRAREAQEGKRILHALMENIPEGITIFDAPDGRIRFASKYAQKLTGHTLEKILDDTGDRRRVWRLYHKDGRTPANTRELPFRRVIQDGETIMDEEWVMRRPAGSQITVVTNAGPIRDENGSVIAGVAAWQDISRRKRVEEALHYRVRFERLISTLSTRFINLTTAKIDRGIETALRLIGLFAGAERSYLFLFDKSMTLMSDRYEWVKNGIKPQKDQLQNLRMSDFSWLMPSLSAGKSVLVTDVNMLPPQAVAEAAIFEAGDIKSLICVPLISRSTTIGFVGFDAVTHRQRWSDNVVKLLQIVGTMFVNAIERKRIDEKLQRSEWTYRSIFENTGTATTIVEHDTTISLVNEEFAHLLGYAKQEVEGKMSWRQVAHPDDLPKLEDYHNQRSRDSEEVPSRYEARLVDRNGKVLDIMIVAGFIRGTDKSVVTFLNMTDRKEYERKLAREREIAEQRAREAEEGRRILEAVMDYIPEAIIVADGPDVRIRMMSRYARRLLGLTDGEVAVSNHERPDRWGFYHLDGTTLPSPEELPLSRTVRDGEEVLNEEWVIKRPDGRSVIILVNSGPIYNRAGEITGGVVAWRDITQRKMAEEAVRDHSLELERVNRTLVTKNRELDEANARLKELDSLKSEFVSMASHELRTPLTGIIGFAETLSAKDIQLTDREREKYLSIIEAEGKRLGLLLGELLDISKIERGVHELVTSMINVAGLARETVSSMQIPDEVHISVEAGDERKLRAPIDHDRMKQVFMNIVDNAVNYSRQKADITIRVSLKDEKTIRVSISDNGPGIPGDELYKIFEKFYRSRRNPPGESRGSGLGLSIAKGIIEAHGGKIWAESELGKGTTIIFTISKSKSEYADSHY